ncbi:MAG TPA: sorbosone dehydrogenase family protein [Anaerolineales bacterium]|nr:sorbosone dehydrogenase family protein [Anaerolineales bacterium]
MNKKSIAFNLVVIVGLIVVLVASLGGCGGQALDPSSGYGPDPMLPTPEQCIIPVLNPPNAVGWAEGEKPVAAEGLEVTAFASGLDHPRWVYVLPNGDVLVAETNAPERPGDAQGIKGWFFKLFQKQAGAAVPSANRITLLRDADGDGVAEIRTVFLDGLNSPFGMALVGNTFYVANTDAVVSFPYEEGQTEITATPTKITDLPAGTINHHWTKGLVATDDGSKLYVSVGSNSNVAENGIEQEKDRAAILEVDTQSGLYRVFASGLRNPVGMAWEPEMDRLWVVVNERDEMGDDLVPDYMTAVKDGGFYGWPFSYYGNHLDPRVEPQNPELVATAIVPDYALGSHTAPLGLASSVGTTLPAQFENGMFIGQHGSWNREVPNGYRVIFVPFSDGMPFGDPVEVLTGFLVENGDAKGRPVGVALDGTGALLVADDVGNVIWRVTAAPVTARP